MFNTLHYIPVLNVLETPYLKAKTVQKWIHGKIQYMAMYKGLYIPCI